MKRKFVKVMFFGALALSTVTYVGCKDYDDDVKGLQEQIDNINKKGADVTTEAMTAAINSAVAGLQSQLDAIASKADKTALDELKKTVSEMQTALGKKADAAKLTELQTKLDDAIAKVDASIETSVAEAKKALQAKIDELEDKLEKADEDAAAQVATDLAAAKKEMQKLIDANGEQIKILFEKIDGLNGINAKIKALEEADKNFVSITQLNEYMNSDAVKNYVDETLVGYLTKAEVTDQVNAVKTYVDGVFKSGIMVDIQNQYLSLEVYNKDMEDLNDKIKNYVSTEDATYKKIFTDIQTLTDYQNQTIKALVKKLEDNKTIEQANKVADALTDISGLKEKVALCAKTSDLAAYVKSTDLNDAIDTHLTSTFEAYDQDITTIKNRLLALEIDVDGLKSMVQSVTFIPSSADGKVSFYSYYVIPEGKTEVKDRILVASNNTVVVKFRVSPISAAEKFFENYTATFDGQEFTRAIDIFKGEGKVENKDEGIISFVLSTQTEFSHAVCLNVVSKKSVPENAETVDKGTDYFTDINSDYFPVIVTTKTIKSLEVVSDNSDVKDIYWDNKLSMIDYKEGYALKAKFMEDRQSDPATILDDKAIDLSKFGKPVYNFNVITNPGSDPTIENGGGAYKIVDGVLSLVKYEDESASDGKKAKVVATVTVKDGSTVLKAFESDPYAEVTAKKYAVKSQIVTGLSVSFNGKEDQTLPVVLDYSTLGITEDIYEKLPQVNFNFGTTPGIRFAFKEGTTKNELVVLIPKGTKEGVNTDVGAILDVKVSDTQNFTLNLKKVTVTLDKNAYKLTWNENVVTTTSLIAGSVSLMPQFTDDAVGFESNLATLFENYAAIAESAEKVGASIKFSLKDKITGVTIEGNKLKITNAYENVSTDIVVEAKVIAKSADNKDYALAENTMSATFSLTGVTTAWVWDNNKAKSLIKIGSDNYTGTFPLAKGIKWTCGGKTMWEDGTASKASDKTILLSVLGLEAPVYTITEDDKQYVEIDKTGNLKVKSLGTAIVRNITVTITAESRWGTITDYAGHKTVTVKIDMNKESSVIAD